MSLSEDYAYASSKLNETTLNKKDLTSEDSDYLNIVSIDTEELTYEETDLLFSLIDKINKRKDEDYEKFREKGIKKIRELYNLMLTIKFEDINERYRFAFDYLAKEFNIKPENIKE